MYWNGNLKELFIFLKHLFRKKLFCKVVFHNDNPVFTSFVIYSGDDVIKILLRLLESFNVAFYALFLSVAWRL